MKIIGILITLFAVLAASYLLIGIGTIMKNGTSLTAAPGTGERLKLFLSRNSAETTEDSLFPELKPHYIAWNTNELKQFTAKVIHVAESLGYQLHEHSEQNKQAAKHMQILHFTITTKTFKFIDDLYVYIDIDGKNGFIVNAKSSSRTGRADFGANIANIQKLFDQFDGL